MLRLAVAKGRLEDESLEFLERCGFVFPDRSVRRLLTRDSTDTIEILSVKPADVPVYVDSGAADLGICGTDSVVESELYMIQPFKLPFGNCRMVLAGLPDFKLNGRKVRVATKFPVSAAMYFQSKRTRAEIVRLNGSVELAPLVGLADAIVDIVQTGRTLREHGLVVVDELYEVSAVLCVNGVSYRTKRTELQVVFDRIWKVLGR